MSKLTDAELWNDVSFDSSRAFTVLYNRYWKKIFKTANYYLKDEFAAKEITHDVFLTLWNKRKKLTITNFEAYIHVAARYHVFSYLKKVKASRLDYIDEFTEAPNLVVFNAVNDKLRYDDLESELSILLKSLPRRCSEIFWLSRVESLSNEEIANRLNISKRTVENQITIALRHLRLSYPKLMVSSMMVISFLFKIGNRIL